MRVVYLIRGLYNSGGMEKIIIDKANYLSEVYGYDVHIITTDNQERENFFKLSPQIKTTDLKVNFQELDNLEIPAKIIVNLKKRREYRKKLEVLLEEVKPDLVISTFGPEAYFLYKLKYKSILELHFCKNFKVYQVKYFTKNKIRLMAAYLKNMYDNFIVRKYKKFVVLTNEDLGRWNSPNAVVIPNMIKSNRNSEGKNKITKKAIAVGRLDYEKGFEDLIETWKILDNRKCELVLHIYGEGPLKSKLQKLILTNNLEEKIKLMGVRKNLDEIYLEYDFLIFTSRFEGFGMVLAEAQSKGLVVISYECPCGPKEIIRDGENGFLVEKNNISALTDKILMLTKNQEIMKKISENAIKNSHKYENSKIMPLWKKMIENIVSS